MNNTTTQKKGKKTSLKTNLKLKIRVGETAIRHGETLYDAYNMRYGIHGWYKAYIISEDFQGESNDFKKKSFETYERLMQALGYMEPVIDQFDKSIEDL